jgi:hypothetical protein
MLILVVLILVFFIWVVRAIVRKVRGRKPYIPEPSDFSGAAQQGAQQRQMHLSSVDGSFHPSTAARASHDAMKRAQQFAAQTARNNAEHARRVAQQNHQRAAEQARRNMHEAQRRAQENMRRKRP